MWIVLSSSFNLDVTIGPISQYDTSFIEFTSFIVEYSTVKKSEVSRNYFAALEFDYGENIFIYDISFLHRTDKKILLTMA